MQTADPAAPSDSSWKVYAKAGGIYARSSNSVVGPFAAGGGGFTFSGVLLTLATQTISNATITAISGYSETYDTSSFHDTGSNTSRITLPATKRYRIEAAAYFGFSESNEFDLFITKNGSTSLATAECGFTTHTSTAKLATCGIPINGTAGDYYELYVYHDNGSSRALTAIKFACTALE